MPIELNTYSFHHSHFDRGESAALDHALNESLLQCEHLSCISDVSPSVEQLAVVGLKPLVQYFSSLLTQPGSEIDLLPTFHFGWMPVYNEILRDCDNDVDDKPGHRSEVMEFGGGSGAGFQVYCDDVLVLTAGGGGGACITVAHANIRH
jgi:hypothetical protein